jgi:hypothetical protein
MSMMVFADGLRRLLRDESARLAPIPVRETRAMRRALRQQARRESRATPLLLVGAVACFYVAARIGLTYLLLPH